MDLVTAGLQHMGQFTKAVHGHPWAVRTTDTGRTAAGGRRLNDFLTGRRLAHPVEDALVRGHDKFAGIHCFYGVDQAGRGTDIVGLFDHAGGRLRVHQHLRVRMLFTQGL